VVIQDGSSQPIFLDLNGGVGIVPVTGIPNFGTAIRSNNAATQNFTTATSSGFAVTPATSTTTVTGSPSQNTTTGTTDVDGGITSYNLYQAINTDSTTVEVSTGESVGIPAVGAINTLTLVSTTNLNISDVVTIAGYGTFQVQSVAGLIVTLINVNGSPVGGNFQSGVVVTWSHIGQQMPPGRMGAYGLGRNWLSLPGGLNFIAGDIVRGASGTAQYNFRDAVLNVTENSFIVGGGTFSIPASGGETIQAIMFLATLNVALGQGPVQVFTNYRVFSCNAPVDRLTWQSLTNPILTVSLIGAGAEGQNSTVMANGDPLFRSVDGIRSLTFSTINFYNPKNLWSNTPLSFEVSPVLNADNTALLEWGSSIVFDNRRLETVGPVQSPQGVYFTGLVPINFDTVSKMAASSTPVWDSGVWTGMNVLQLEVGEVGKINRAFAFCLNTSTAISGIEIYEILPSTGPLSSTADFNGVASVPITWQFDSPSLRFGVPKTDHVYMFLSNGEIAVGSVVGSIDFNVQYKPDQFPLWTNWRNWTSCQSPEEVSADNPGFLPRMGLGEPSAIPCDCSTNRPMRNCFTAQVRTIITGHCVFLGGFFESQTQPMPAFAKICC
jgi:hypothetical protein